VRPTEPSQTLHRVLGSSTARFASEQLCKRRTKSSRRARLLVPDNSPCGRNGSIVASMAQLPRVPNLDAQRTAMKALSFLAGKWTGEACLYGPTERTELHQTEDAQYKLDGLILIIEGIGRNKSSGHPVLQALGILSFDDESGRYRMRAFNDGRFLETEVTLLKEGQGLKWGFALGQIRTNSVLRINETGEWTEVAEITISSEPPRKLLELTVRQGE